MKKTIALITLVALGLSALFVALAPTPPANGSAPPWVVQQLSDGDTRALGLQLGRHASTLGDARHALARQPDALQIAVIADTPHSGTLEAYADQAVAGGITGKVVVSAALDAHTVQRIKRAAIKIEPLPSGAWRHVLPHTAPPEVWAAPIASITFIPATQLDAATVAQRFGTPTQRIRTSKQAEHWLYPAIGLDIALNEADRAVLQYVAPAQFEQLRQPLLQQVRQAAPAR